MTQKLKVLSFSILAIIILVMVVATLVEKVDGTTQIYGSWWFASLWAMLVAVSVFYVFKRKLHKRPVVFLLHLSFAAILLGALITHCFGISGIVHLREGSSTKDFVCEDHSVKHFPFTVCLEEFEVLYYPGTTTPMDYVSVITCNSLSNDKTWIGEKISMNNIAEIDGYRFYQSSYDDDMQGSILAVSYDPWGISITYFGYAMLFLSMVLLLILPNEGFRKALRKVTQKALSIIVVFSVFSSTATAKEKLPTVLPDSVAQRFCDLYAYYNGRICPLQTIAYDFSKKLYGKTSYKGLSAEQVFTGWYFFPSTWVDTKTKERKGGEVEIVKQMLLNGQFLKIYPYKSDNKNIVWLSQGDNLPMDMPEDEWFFVKKSMDYIGELAVTKNYDKLIETIEKINKYQLKQAVTPEGVSLLPSDNLITAEKIYNRHNYTKPLAMALMTLFFVLIPFFLNYWIKGKEQRLAILRAAGTGILIIVAIYLCFLLGIRWYVSGHLPLTNGFETMQFMSLCVILIAILMQKRFPLIIPFGFLMGGLTLLVSMMGQANPQITPLMPVLSSPLLSIHVCVIMIAYTLLAFIMLNGIVALIPKLSVNITTQLTNISHLLLYPAIFCLAAGIFIGAIWANVSWGRYWGWDPKEVWALITLLVYSFAFHKESLPIFKRPKVFHLFLIIAFLTVLMTYFGVNYLLGGMHSYANS